MTLLSARIPASALSPLRCQQIFLCNIPNKLCYFQSDIHPEVFIFPCEFLVIDTYTSFVPL